jgi:hypothetical protein
MRSTKKLSQHHSRHDYFPVEPTGSFERRTRLMLPCRGSTTEY